MCFHGGNIVSTAKQLGCQVSDLIDMSSNLTPFGPVPGLHTAIIQRLDEIAYLPETANESLVETFATKFRIKPQQVIAGNGTSEFIFALPTLFSGGRALIINPTYSDYRVSCERNGVEVQSFILHQENNFRVNLEDLADHLKGGELVFICNPNNPTSTLISSRILLELITAHPLSTFVVDESYLPFTREKSLLNFDLPPNVYILCSFSKIYGIPGLRLGFLVSTEENIHSLNKRIKPWGVNRLAQISGEFLLVHADKYVTSVVDFLEKERPEFIDQLNRIKGINVVPGEANFILSHLEGDTNVTELQEKILRKRIMIRNCDTFEGLGDGYFRISLKDKKTNTYCFECLKEILGV